MIFQRALSRRSAQFYQELVEQARRRIFYEDWQVPDDFSARFDMIVLHLALVVERLQRETETPSQARKLLKQLMRCFTADMDRNLREMGVGDLSVSKKIKQMTEGFFGRAAAYRRGLQSEDNQELSNALWKNIYQQDVQAQKALEKMTTYVQHLWLGLEQVSLDRLLAGNYPWPVPTSQAVGDGKLCERG